MNKKTENALLFLENCCAHVKTVGESSLKHVAVKFIAPNMTNILQSWDCRIIKSFKSQYRKLFLEDAELHLNKLESYKFTIKDVIYLLGKA